MKKADLKKLIKPLVKECITEVMIEEGMLSSVVSEVVKGMQGELVVEQRQAPSPLSQPNHAQAEAAQQEQRRKIQEHRRKLLGAIDQEAYNGVDLFEGTEPMTQYEATPTPAGSADLGHPGDSGVNIDSLIGNASKVWKAIK